VRITDTHAHIYSSDTERYPLVENPLLPPEGTGSIAHLRSEMAAAGVHRVVAIHTSTAYRWDNRFITESARENAPWMVGVCTLNPEDSASPDLLRRYVSEFNIRGMRSVPAGPNRETLDHPGVHALWSTAEDVGIPINALIHVDMADQLETMLARHPGLRVVLDHCMYPKGKDGMVGETITRVLAMSKYENLYAKLTWLVESSDEDAPFRDTHALLRAVVDAYGPERCVWGSDFPCELWTPKAEYGQTLELFRTQVALTNSEQEQILDTTPGRLWFGDR